MLYHLCEEPSQPLPSRLEIRPLPPEHMRQVWEAQRDMNAGLFENVAEDWLDEKYPAWLANPENKPRRGRGPASALIARSLQVLKAQGATEVELDLDAENENAAFHLYEYLGYKTFSVDT